MVRRSDAHDIMLRTLSGNCFRVQSTHGYVAPVHGTPWVLCVKRIGVDGTSSHRKIDESQPEVIVACPGRLNDFIQSGALCNLPLTCGCTR